MSQESYLADYVAISQVKANYCLHLDTKDWAAYADLFTEDLEYDTSGEVVRGRDAAMEDILKHVTHAKTAHHVHSPIIEVAGDTAKVVWAMQDRVIWEPGAPNYGKMAGHTGYGHYRERYRRENGRWRICAMQLRYLIFEGLPPAAE